ncbi:MAG: carboxyl transferase domain-containing protein [Oscillospiraceae bacterium]|nr:carboxyl transferase domain-containing protein [Oscillospiraceae bacterium]
MHTQTPADTIVNMIRAINEAEEAKAKKAAETGRLTARARLKSLFDEGSFTEIGAFFKKSGSPESESDTVICAYGALDGRLIYAFSQEYTESKAGFGETQAVKIAKLYELATKNGAPIVAFLDSAGANISENISVISSYGKIIKCANEASGMIPQIAVVTGICGGAAAIYASACDFIVAEKNNSSIYLSAPSIVRASDSKAGAGFSKASDCCARGICAAVGDGEADTIAKVKRLLSFIPSNCEDGNIQFPVNDDPNRPTLCFNGEYSASSVITGLADEDSIFELYVGYAAELKCGFAVMGGIVCGFIASDGGKLTASAMKKAAGFVCFCDMFGISLLTLVDSDGFDATEEASDDLAGAASDLFSAYAISECPKVTVYFGKAYGSVSAVLGGKETGTDLAFALPFAEISVLAPETATALMWNDKLRGEKDPIAGRAALVEKWRSDMASPIAAAQCGMIDDVIMPDELRARLIAAFDTLSSR